MHQTQFLKILKTQIICLQTETPLGRVSDMIFNPETKTIQLMRIKIQDFFSSHYEYILWEDIIWQDSFFWIQNLSTLFEENDLIRYKEIFTCNCTLLHFPVHTSDDIHIGNVYDYSFDLTTGSLLRIHVNSNNLFENKRMIIPLSGIFSMTCSKIKIYNNNKIEEFEAEKAEKFRKFGVEPTLTLDTE